MTEDIQGAAASASEPALVASLPEPVPVSAHSGDGQAQGPREPIVLVAAEDPDKTPLLYACAGCGSVHSPAIYLARKEVQHATAKEAARDCYTCKTHSNCQYCGAECGKGWTACETCRFARKLEAAVEVPDDGGPYCAFDGDTYYTEMEEAADAGLEWVSPCEVTYPRIDPDSVLENLLDDMHEDASVDDMDGVDAFYEAVKAFNEAQRTQSWFGDVKRKIRVPASVTGTGTAETRAAPGEACQNGQQGDAQTPQSQSVAPLEPPHNTRKG